MTQRNLPTESPWGARSDGSPVSREVIPQANPRASYEAHRAEIDSAIQKVLQSGTYILGPETDAFEHEFAHFLGVAHAVGVASGTDALHLALRAAGVKAGDRVLTVANTAVATVAAIEMAGATAVFVDVDDDTLTMDPAKVER